MLLGDVDRMAYEILADKDPELLDKIKAAIDKGLSAKAIQSRILWKYGSSSIGVHIVICAAFHCERLRKEAKGNESK